jgi:hypothetical protein
MKKVKYACAALAILTATATMSFTTTSDKEETKADALDCWSSTALFGTPPNVDQASQCPGSIQPCCFKPNGSGGFIAFGHN